MSMFCSSCGIGKNAYCCSKEYYMQQYRVDSNGRALPVSAERLSNVYTVIIGNLVFSANGGNYATGYYNVCGCNAKSPLM